MLPLLVKRNRVSADANKDLLSPIDYVPAACAAWRLHMLNEGTPSAEELANLKQPVMLVRERAVSFPKSPSLSFDYRCSSGLRF